MKMCLETSCIIGFLNGEPDCEPVGRLLTLAETGHIELFVSDFARKETYKPLDKLGISRKERLRYVTEHLPKVARIGEWRIGLDVLGHDDSAGIERTLLQASRLDGEQFLSYAAFSLTFFATKDNGYLKKSVRSKLIKQ